MKKLLVSLGILSMILFLNTCAAPAPEEVPDYLQLMQEAAVTGDLEAGRQAARERNTWLDRQSSREERIDFDQLFLLSRLIEGEAGEARFSDEMRMCVGEVALNRVLSPEFPNSLAEVVYQPGQYRCVSQPEFKDGILPGKVSVRVALRLLQGERMLEPQVLYQSVFPLGPVYAQFYDSVDMRVTYFCESVNRDLYEVPAEAADL